MYGKLAPYQMLFICTESTAQWNLTEGNNGRVDSRWPGTGQSMKPLCKIVHSGALLQNIRLRYGSKQDSLERMSALYPFYGKR